MAGKIYIVHAIDTEGPLFESIETKFERLRELFGITNIEATERNLELLSRGEIDLGEKTNLIQRALKSHKSNTLGTWEEIHNMWDEVCSKKFRNILQDSEGNGWVYNWYCMDHTGFIANPRKRDLGHHKIHDQYTKLLQDQPWSRDVIEFHFHPISTFRDAHRCATHYLRTEDLYQILCRRIIDRNFFPSGYRAGFQAERPDSHWFLEQYIPFDISNMATECNDDIDNSIDFKKGRSGNWRKAPHDWSVYHPSHDDYQIPGNCRRLIGRALNLQSRIACMSQHEMDKAFQRADSGSDTVVGLCSHDWRHLGPEVDFARTLLNESNSKYPNVNFVFSDANTAFRSQIQRIEEPLKLSLRFFNEVPGEDVPYIEIKTIKGTVFGPQPFLAIKTTDGTYIHDNFDFSSQEGVWYYAFHGDTLSLDKVASIGVAANDAFGNTQVLHYECTV